MIKKIIAVVLTAVMTLVMSEAAYAQNITTDGGSVDVPVRYTVNNTAFVITVPEVITAQVVDTQFSIGASYMNLRPDEYVEVTITSGCDAVGTVELIRQGAELGRNNDSLETTLTANGKVISDNRFVVGYFSDSNDSTINQTGPITMSGLKVNENTQAGDYEALVEFTVTLRDE